MAGPAVESWTVYGQAVIIIELPVGISMLCRGGSNQLAR